MRKPIWEHATVPGWCPCKDRRPERCKPEEHPDSDHVMPPPTKP